MNQLLFVVLGLIAVSSYVSGYLLSFKKRYKKWQKNLFKSRSKPIRWGISRQTNHNRYELVHYVQLVMVAAFLIISMLCAEDITIPLWLYTVILVAAVLFTEILGVFCGKRGCDKKVRQECKKCGIDIPVLWKNLQGYLGDFCFNCQWLINLEIHCSIYLLNSIKF